MAKVKRGFTFNYIDVRKPNFSKFNLSHDHLVALKSGFAIPIWWTEGLPGDLWKCNLSAFVRLLALSSPMLQREDIFVRAFKVPWRILADRKDLDKAFAGDQQGNHIDFPFIECNYSQMDVGSLADYMQLPLPYEFNSSTGAWSKIAQGNYVRKPSVSIFPFLAYHRIYHDHFRNEETENSYLDVFEQHYSVLDGKTLDTTLQTFDSTAPQGIKLGTLRKVCWERDYFTSALSSTQRGAQVNIPLLGTQTVPVDNEFTGGQYADYDQSAVVASNYSDPPGSGLFAQSTINENFYKINQTVTIDGSQFSGIGAIALRLCMNLQAFLERNNIAGYRMIGNILAHFGVHSSNGLHDEAEYLGGIKAPISIGVVNQTSATESTGTPQGTQVGTGQSSFSDHLFTTFCEEPCVIMVIAYINAKSGYSQGLARKFTRRSYLDLYWPEFQTIGEQEILNKEVFFTFKPTQDSNDAVWAYQSRFAEYKYEPDTVAGEFRTSLSYWHQSRLFTSLPAFNNNFVLSNPSDRVFALNSTTYPAPYLAEFYFDVQVVRAMNKYATSKLW